MPASTIDTREIVRDLIVHNGFYETDPQAQRIYKDLCWAAEEAVMQLHPPRSKWINNHPYCLHLWRPLNQEIPLPPEIAVAIPGLEMKP